MRINLGDKYGLAKWLFSAYEEILCRKESLSSNEATALGLDRVICYVRARDFMHREQLEIAQEDLQNHKARIQALEEEREKSVVLRKGKSLQQWPESRGVDSSVLQSRLGTGTSAAVAVKMYFGA